MPVPDRPPGPSRDDDLREALQNVKQLTIEVHRLRARLSRLEAAGEDEKADRLTAELRGHEEHLERDRRIVQLYAPDALPPIERPTPREEVAPISDPPTPEPAEGQGAEEQLVPRFDVANKGIAPSLARKNKRRRALWDFRKQPAVTASTMVHVVIFLALGLLTFVSVQNPPPMLSSGVVEGDDLADELTEVPFEPVELQDHPVDEMNFESLSPELAELDLPIPGVELAATELTIDVGTTDIMTLDTGALLAEVGGAVGESEASGGGGPPPTVEGEASFFGKRSRGNRFVFLIDNSGSMKGGRLETTFLELLNSVGAMKPDQMFYVVFYSDQAYSMFHPAGVDEMVPATRDNKRKLEAWLATVEMCTGGELNDAVDLATDLEPAAVYVLSDGEIFESRIRRLVDNAPRRKYPIHTLGMTVRNQEDAANLIAIAEAHEGTYTPVGINPAAVQMSKARPIRYNRAPAEVWGNKIRKW